MAAYVTVARNLQFKIIELRKESATCRSIVFARPPKVNYEPGDWVDICFDDDPAAGIKTFSFSSSPTEADLMITYKQGISPFKRRLQALRAGDKVWVVQYGNSGFNLDKKHPAIILAGGVGIAPFRSMVCELVDEGTGLDVSIFYQSKFAEFAFQREFDEWTRVNPYLNIRYLDSVKKERIDKKLLAEIVSASTSSRFYIAGPPGMVENTENILLELGVNPDFIHDDAFTGY